MWRILCVWLTRDTKEMRWSNGRFVSATWDVGELEGRRREETVEKDLLKWKMETG